MQARIFSSIMNRNIHPFESALFEAIGKGNEGEVKTTIGLIETRAVIAPTDQSGPSFAFAQPTTGVGFLLFAIESRQLIIAQYLLNYFLNKRTDQAWVKLHFDPIWIVDRNRRHALLEAASLGADDLVTQLISSAKDSPLYFTDSWTTSSRATPFDISTRTDEHPLVQIARHCKQPTLQAALDFVNKLPLPNRLLSQLDGIVQQVPHGLTDATADTERLEQLALNHRDIAALKVHLEDLVAVFMVPHNNRYAFMRRTNLQAIVVIYGLLAVLSVVADLFAFAFPPGMDSQILLGIIGLVLTLATPLFSGFALFQHFCNSYPTYGEAIFVLNLFCQQSALNLPVSHDAALLKELNSLIEDLTKLQTAVYKAEYYNPYHQDITALRNIIYNLKMQDVTLIRATEEFTKAIACIDHIDKSTVETDKKPIAWQFYKRQVPQLMSSSASDEVELSLVDERVVELDM